VLFFKIMPALTRPLWQAALAVMDNIRRLRKWEEMNESSKLFRECAAQIDAEFRAEEKHCAVVSARWSLRDHRVYGL
jgi:hypothetical protein